MAAPRPPCGMNCPRRCAVPNCHDPERCSAWGEFLRLRQAFDAAVSKARGEDDDYKAARHREVKRHWERKQRC